MKNKEVQESLRQVGIRLIEEPPLLSPESMSSPEAAVRVLGEWLSEMDRELFCVVNLNSNLTPINMNVVSMGALNVAYVHPRDAMKSAILSNAAYMMLIHNHPSGSMTPSKEDIKITDQIQSAASLMGIPVLDHIIVGRHQEFFSIRENNVFSYQNDMQYTSDISKLRWTQQSSVAESTSYGGQNSDVTESKMDTIMNSLEKGVHEIFTSEKYHIYLNTMSKFHNYSFNNTLLIAMQRPDATLVAGYQTWKKKFNRQVQRGEKGIKIIAPAPIKEKRRVEKVDEETQEIVIGDDGQPETEIVERITPRFRVTTVFDVSQTEGEPLPTLGTTEPDELAYKIHDGYFSIHRTDGGYDYTFYTKDYEDIDGGIYDNPDSPIKQVVEDILEDAGISLDDAEWMDYEELDAEVEHAEEIKQLAVDLDKFSYEYDTYEYKDSIEDREEQIDKLTEDILTRKTDDIKKWLIEVSENSEIDNDVRTARSLFSRLEEAERIFISDETNVSFYAAECMEFPDFGELHENLTLDEAIKKYESIPEERMHGVKGIGFELEDGSDYEGKYGLMYHGRVDRENVEMIQYYKDNPVIQKALDALEQYCETSADKSVERQQETNRKKKQKSIYQGLHR